MARRYFNWTLAIVLLVAVAVFAGAVFALHRWQRSSRAEHALPLGEAAYAEENWDEAADQLGRYLALRNDDVPVLLKYADAQMKRRPVIGGNVGQAVEAYRMVLRIDPGHEEAARRVVEFYLATGSAGEAEQVASTYVSQEDSPDMRRLLALAFGQQRKYTEAAQTLLDLVRNHPEEVPTYEMLARVAQERPTEVNVPPAEWFDRAVKANPQSAMAYIIRGSFLRQKGRSTEAMADFDQAAKCDLADLGTRLRLAQELVRAGVADKAKEHLAAIQAKSPKEPGLWQTWAAAVLAGGSAEEKARIAEGGLKELAAYPWDFMGTAVELFVAANQPEKAQECVTQMRQRGLPAGLLAFLDGLVAGARGNFWEVSARWQEALTQGHAVHAYAGGVGTAMPVRMMIASAYTGVGDLQSARIQLQMLIAENPSYAPEARLALARLLTRMRDWAGVLEQSQQVLRVAPEHQEARLLELQARVFLLSSADQTQPDVRKQWQDVESQLAKLDQAMNGVVQTKLLQAQALIRQGKTAEAAKLVDEAMAKDPSDVRTVLLKVDLLAGQNKYDEAIAVLRDAIAKSPQAQEPVQTLATILNRQGDVQQCESVVREAMARMEQPASRRDLGLFLADLYRVWARADDLQKWLTDMAGQFPNDILVKRRLLLCPAIAGDPPKAQTLVDQIKAIEGPAGWQWRYEQAKIWLNSPDFTNRYTQISTMLTENLQRNPDDQASRMVLAAAHGKAGQKQLALSAYREALNRSPNDIVVITQTVAALYQYGGAAGEREAKDILRKAGERNLQHPDLETLKSYGERMQWQGQIARGAYDSASTSLQEFVRENPDDTFASLWLVRISMRQGKLDEAEVILKDLEAKSPEAIPVVQARTQLLLLKGNTQEALRLCDDTVKKNGQATAYLLRAWTYAGMRENDKAIEDFNQAVAKDPNNAGIWMDRASFYQGLGRREDAIRDVRKAMSLPPGKQSILEHAIPLCMISGSRTLVEEAEASLDRARQLDPNDPSLKLLKAQVLLGRGTRPSVEQAERLLREITLARPELPEAWHLLGRLEMDQKQSGKALDAALGGLSHNEGDKNLLLLKADAEAARSPGLALPTLKPLREQYPDDLEVEVRLASALYRSGSKSEGRAMLEARMKTDPNNPVPPVTLAALLGSEERWTEVGDVAASWIARHPNDVVVVPTIARSLVAGGKAEALKTAESLLNSAVERNPKSVSALGSLAMLKQSAGRTAEATELCRKVIELDPNNIIALNNLAWMLCEDNGRYQEALELAERGLKVASDYADLLDTRGVVLYRLGQLEKASADFTRAIELYASNAPSVASVYFHLGRVCAKLGNTGQALQYLKQATDLHKRTGGLSEADLAEANALIEQPDKGR